MDKKYAYFKVSCSINSKYEALAIIENYYRKDLFGLSFINGLLNNFNKDIVIKDKDGRTYIDFRCKLKDKDECIDMLHKLEQSNFIKIIEESKQ